MDTLGSQGAGLWDSPCGTAATEGTDPGTSCSAPLSSRYQWPPSSVLGRRRLPGMGPPGSCGDLQHPRVDLLYRVMEEGTSAEIFKWRFTIGKN